MCLPEITVTPDGHYVVGPADDGTRIRDLAVQHRADTMFSDALAKKTDTVPRAKKP